MWSSLKELPKKMKERLINYKRVLIIARKPDKDELIYIAKICAIGIGLVGAIGFVIYSFAIIFLR